MNKNKWQQILLLYSVIFIKNSGLDESCRSVKDVVEWPSTTNQTWSQPKCLDQNKEFLYRTCSNGEWSPEPQCSSIQPETLPGCPENFIEAETFCYQFTPETIFPPECDFDNILPFNTYKKVITKDTYSIWVPATRTSDNGMGFMTWIEPSWLYKTEVMGYNFSTPITGKNCIIYADQTFKLVPCSDKYRGVCAYSKLELQSDNNLCNSTIFRCLRSDFSPKSKCFCVSHFLHLLTEPKAEFLKPYQNKIYPMLTNKSCTIGLKKTEEGKYIWSNSQIEIDYTYWSPNVTFDDTKIYGIGTPNGWILVEHPHVCSIVEKNISVVEPSLTLEFDNNNYRFTLRIDNPRYIKSLNSALLVRCFTDADSMSLAYIYETFEVLRSSKDSVLYGFEPIGHIPGYYWCEAFKYIDLSVIKTDVHFVRRGDFLEFVGIFQVNYSEINPLSSDIVRLVDNVLFARLNKTSEMKIYTPRIMKIVHLDEENQHVVVNVHFSATIQNIMTDEDSQYMTLKTLIKQTFDPKEITMVDFLSPDFCAATSETLTWPKASIGSFVSPKEFCFDSDGNPVTRSCNGNFVDGAKWESLKNCTIFENSAVSDRLQQIPLNFSGPEAVAEIYNITQNYQSLKPLDVYLIGKFYSEFLNVSNIEILMMTIDNLLNVNKSVLREAQLKSRATDKLLYFLKHVTFESETPFKMEFEKFAFVSQKSKDFAGIAVLKLDDEYIVDELKGDYTLENITKIENLESAIWLSPLLRKDIESSDRVTFYLYFENSFFQQNKVTETSFIFGMVPPETARIFDGPVNVIHRSKSSKRTKTFCAYWNYGLSHQGSWNFHGRAPFYPPFLMCDFWFSANFAILGDIEESALSENVTDNLLDLLASNSSAPEKMDQLYRISKKYHQFQAVDVAFVAQILEKVGDEEISLTHLAKIVSNMQEINPEILLQSQVDAAATDKILANIDHITSQFPETAEIMTDNLMVLVVKYETSFKGLALFQKDFIFEMKILSDNLSLEEVIESDDFHSAVFLSPALQAQIMEDATIVVTVFMKGVLFNEASGKKTVDIVFGVILPEIGDYNGPISILYKDKESGNEHQCVYWHYDTFQNVAGSWEIDDTSKISSDFVHCDFWHTTHFTHLIIPKDSENYFDILDLITSINCVISLVSLSCIILTAAFFKCWRENTGNQILLNFTFAIILQITVFYISSLLDLSESYLICTLVGVLLHYTIVSQFCWMLVIAILQFRRFVIVLEGPPKSVLLKACVCGWALPLLPVGCLFLLDKNNYVKSKGGLCYPSDLGLYLGVWLPICMIIVVNFVIFLITLYNVVHKKTECVTLNNYDSLYQWRLAVLLFFLLGFTWSFGFLALLDFGLTFEYLFCMTATLQGFILFLFFIVFNADTRYLYIRTITKYCKKKFK